MAQNLKQQAAAELSIAIGHLTAALHLWSPGTGLSPAEERDDPECQAWRSFNALVKDVQTFAAEEGPGA